MSNPKPGAQRIRCLIDISKWQAALTDLIPGAGAPVIANGADLQFELAFFDGTGGAAFSDSNSLDFSTTNNLVVALQTTSDPHNSLQFWSSIIAGGALTACTVANWNNGTAQHAKVAVPASNNSLQLTGSGSGLWLVVYSVSSDATPLTRVLSASRVNIVDSGLPLQFGAWYLPYSGDGLVYQVSIDVDDQGNKILVVSQTGVAAPGVSAPFLTAPDGTHHTPILTVSGPQMIVTLS
jgi:hypothetical protein